MAVELRGEGATAGPVVLVFDSGALIGVGVDGPAAFDVGPPRPWIGGPGWRATDDPTRLLAALDPFGDDA